jgi:hypothetical protein
VSVLPVAAGGLSGRLTGVAGVPAAAGGELDVPGAGLPLPAVGGSADAGAGSGEGSVAPGSLVEPPPESEGVPAGVGSLGPGVESAGAGGVLSAGGAAGVSVAVTSPDGSALTTSALALAQKMQTSDATRTAKPQRRKRPVGP